MKCYRNFLIISFLLSLQILTIYVMPAFAAVKHQTTQEMKRIAEPILDNILEGLELENYLTYSKDFAQNLKVIGFRTKFFEVCRYVQKSLGNYMSREYMGVLHKGDMIIVLWKGSFDKTKNDILIKLFLSEKNKRYVVTGLRLQ